MMKDQFIIIKEHKYGKYIFIGIAILLIAFAIFWFRGCGVGDQPLPDNPLPPKPQDTLVVPDIEQRDSIIESVDIDTAVVDDFIIPYKPKKDETN